MLTMLLGGLWHGASWNFVIWGGFHGALLSLERIFYGKRRLDETRITWFYPIRAVFTFGLVLISWVFFRSADLPQSGRILAQMFNFTGWRGKDLLQPWHFGLAGVALLLALLEEHWQWFEKLLQAPAWAYAGALTLMFFCLELFAVIDVQIPFIYFQF